MQHSKGSKELLDAIGNTPLIRLRGPSEATGCDPIVHPVALVTGTDHFESFGYFFVEKIMIYSQKSGSKVGRMDVAAQGCPPPGRVTDCICKRNHPPRVQCRPT